MQADAALAAKDLESRMAVYERDLLVGQLDAASKERSELRCGCNCAHAYRATMSAPWCISYNKGAWTCCDGLFFTVS